MAVNMDIQVNCGSKHGTKINLKLKKKFKIYLKIRCS